MANVRIWTVESDYDAEALKSLVQKLTTNLKFQDLSVQTVSSKTFLMSNWNDKASLNGKLKKEVRDYLRQDDYVIFFLDSDSPMLTHQQPQELEALVNQIKQIVTDPGFAGKVFFAPGVQELESRLWRAHLGIEDPDRAARMDYAEAQFRQLCTSRGLDWDAMTETDRERFVDDLIHEDRECAQ